MSTYIVRSAVVAAALSSTALPALAHPPGGYGDLVEKVGPAVVFIQVETTITPAAGSDEREEMFREFRRRFGDRFPMPEMPEFDDQPRQGLGSGFIIDGGRIVTNQHVIGGAEKVTVTLADGRKFDATVVGEDPLTDIAVLKIDADGLTAVELGNSDALRVGDSVVAMGSPFGLGGTVTSGIVSALSRDINAGPFDDFIQTDAAINRGNSGGPLFNEDGEVIGMNTAIFSPRGGSVGIGFAVPSDLIETVVADLSDDGVIQRGWLGVQIRPMTDEVAEVLGYDAPRGAVVEEVFDDTPAARAGFEEGDIILKVDGKDVEDTGALPRIIAGYAPDTMADITVLRKGEELSLEVTLGLRTADPA